MSGDFHTSGLPGSPAKSARAPLTAQENGLNSPTRFSQPLSGNRMPESSRIGMPTVFSSRTGYSGSGAAHPRLVSSGK